MSCYFRHLQPLFQELGVVPDRQNRQELDRIFHEAVAVAYKDCPATWRALKVRLGEPEQRARLLEALRQGLTRLIPAP